jgi:hypothetical protein
MCIVCELWAPHTFYVTSATFSRMPIRQCIVWSRCTCRPGLKSQACCGGYVDSQFLVHGHNNYDCVSLHHMFETEGGPYTHVYIYIVGRGPMHVKDTLRVLVLVALFETDCCSNMTGVFLLFEPYCSQQCVLFGFLV